MSPVRGCLHRGRPRFPRVSGDEPQVRLGQTLGISFCPHDSAPTSSIRGRCSVCLMCTFTRRAGRSGSVSASHHRQRTQQAQHADVREDTSHVGARAS